jgi:hypothetical protein
MTAAPNFYTKARSETAELLHYDLGCLTPEQSLRLDCAVALRLALDDLQGRIVRGESADVSRMLTASEALARLLPPAVLATPPSDETHLQDPREVMFKIYMEMRERGEVPPEGWHQRRIDILEAEVAALKAQLVGAGLAPALPDANSSDRRTNLAIDPPLSDIVPPGERVECDAGVKPGPDDWRAQRSTTVIEGRANPPAAKATHASPTSWDDTPNGRAWNEWRDAGGYGGSDRWANNNR